MSVLDLLLLKEGPWHSIKFKVLSVPFRLMFLSEGPMGNMSRAVLC